MKENTKLSKTILSAISNTKKYLFVHFSKNMEIIGTNAIFDDTYGTDKTQGVEIFCNEPQIFELLKDKDKFLYTLKNNQYSISLETNPFKDYFISWEIIGITNKGRFSGEIVFLGYDISKEKSEENIVKEKYFSLESMISHLPGNIYWMDKNCVHLGCNNNVLNMLGITREEYVGKTYEDLAKMGCLTWEQIKIFKNNDLEVMRSGKPKFNIVEPIVESSDGRELHFLSTRAPMYNQNGDIVGASGTSIDISELKKAQKDLKEAKEKAEAANLAKSNFLSNMSHDVKTPLSGIIAFSELLAVQVKPSLHHMTKALSNAGKQLMIFFENCIELSKLESSSIVLQKENFSLKNLLEELFQLFEPAIASKKLSLYVDCSDKIPSNLLGNRVALYRILLNLMGNAIKFTKEGSIKVSAELAKRSTSDRAIIKLIVTDTGIGIPQEKQDLIFEKFSRLTPSYDGIYEGHGIGLYIVREFVTSMGGEIYLKSQEGKGTQFTIALPLQISLLDDNEGEEVDEDANEVKSVFSSPQKIISPNAEKPKILLVEDNHMAQVGGKEVLHSLDCHVDIAGSGKDAIDLFKPGKYALIFMDIGLPDMRGYEVSKRLREIEKNTFFHVPILGLSAHASEEDEKLSLEAGIHEMFSKPLLFDQAKKILTGYGILRSIASSDANFKNKLDVISLDKFADNSVATNKTALKMLDLLVKSLPETRAELERFYMARDLKTLTRKIHRLHGAVCYTNTPDLLRATCALETHLKEGKYDRLEMLYRNFLKAMDTLEKVYKNEKR